MILPLSGSQPVIYNCQTGCKTNFINELWKGNRVLMIVSVFLLFIFVNLFISVNSS
jgi:hypothetical protein